MGTLELFFQGATFDEAECYSEGRKSRKVEIASVEGTPEVLPWKILRLDDSYNLPLLTSTARNTPPETPLKENHQIYFENEYWYAILQGRRVGVFYLHK